MFPSRHLIATSTALGAVAIADIVSGRYCEGGHRCSAPKECCAQGCCYLYAPPSPPRTVPPAADHVLNLFFINHWYFWCLVLAIILALLCACSLWKKRRQLCGWGASGAGHSTHSEGDSAGSCYAPPQYSRCSSFHHAPPPYTEVTSKPDLYPLVFSCNGDSGKNGANYLMVQYFRNYIVRPLGSISATSTVDSLSSSFICTVNEANSLVPPPYSRAASPDATTTISINRSFPRSASQHATFAADSHHLRSANSVPGVMNFSGSSSCQPGGSDEGSTPCLRFSDSTNFPYLSSGAGSQNQASPGTVTLNISQSEHHIHAGHDLATSASNAVSNNVLCSPTGTGQSVPVSGSAESFHRQNYEDLSALRRNLEKCCHILQKHPGGKCVLTPGEKSPSALETAGGTMDHYEGLRTFVNSNMDSAVSSLANIESPMSPPQAISPTDEVRELLEQIKQLQCSASACDEGASAAGGRTDVTPETYTVGTRRSLFGKSGKSAYIPFSSVRDHRPSHGTSQRPTSFLILTKSCYPSSGASSYSGSKRGWVSRSAPTTPGTSLPTTNQLTEDSPLLDEHDEEEQNV
ncbi:Ribonuclease H2 subunit B [Sergentomyia squamirostris]